MIRNYFSGFCVLCIAALTSCASVPEDAGFKDVTRTTRERATAHVHWLRGGVEDEVVAKRVTALLAEPLTAEAAVQIALFNNRTLQATYESLGIARANLVQAGLMSNPILSGEVKAAISGPGPEVELSLTKNFLEVLYIPMRKKIAESKLEEAKLQVAVAVLDLAARVRSQHHRVQADVQRLVQRRLITDVMDANVTLAQRLYDAGNITEATLDNHRIAHKMAIMQLADARMTLAMDRQILSGLMGVWGNDIAWSITPQLPAIPVPDDDLDIDSVENLAVERSLDLAAARAKIESSARLAGLSKSTALFSDIGAGAAAKRESDGAWLLGPAFTLPIPLLDQGQARVSAAQSEFRKARFEYNAMLVNVRTTARSAVIRLLHAREKSLTLRDTIVPLHERITTETQKEYNGMLVGAFDLLVAKRREIEAHLSYIDALQDYWIARSSLDSILAGHAADITSSAPFLTSPSALGTPNPTINAGH